MEIRIVDVRRNRSEIRRIWNRLEEGLSNEYFLSSGWVETWLDSLPGDVDPKLVSGFDGGAPMFGFMVAFRHLRRKGLIPVRSAFLNATGVPTVDRLTIEYNRIVEGNGHAPDVWGLLELLDRDTGWDEFVLPGLSADHTPGRQLSTCPERWCTLITRDDAAPYVELDRVRSSPGGYPALLSRNSRSQLRRCYRTYESAIGPVRLEVAQDVNQAEAILDELVALHQRRWRERGREGTFANPYMYRFHRELVRRRFGSGEIQLLRVKAGRHTVGCLYNFVFRGAVLFYQSGFAVSEDNRMKPGWLCHGEAIRHNTEAGHAVYDFLAGATQYKRSLATAERRVVWATVQKRKLRFRLERSASRAKRRLVSPEGAVSRRLSRWMASRRRERVVTGAGGIEAMDGVGTED